MWKDNAGQTNKRIRKTARLSSRSLFRGSDWVKKTLRFSARLSKVLSKKTNGSWTVITFTPCSKNAWKMRPGYFPRLFAGLQRLSGNQKIFYLSQQPPQRRLHQLPGQTFLVVYQMGVGIQNAGASDFDYGFKPNEVGRKRCLDF